MRRGVITIAIGVLVLLCAVAAAQQEMRPTPGPGSGAMAVRGAVDIGTMPPVQAVQQGDWRVAVSNVPTVTTAPPPFARAGGRYAITWATGEAETVTVVEAVLGGWVRVEGSGGARRRWLNLFAARAIAEVN